MAERPQAIEIHDQHAPPRTRERSAEIHRRGRLSHASFAVDDGNNHELIVRHSIPNAEGVRYAVPDVAAGCRSGEACAMQRQGGDSMCSERIDSIDARPPHSTDTASRNSRQ